MSNLWECFLFFGSLKRLFSNFKYEFGVALLSIRPSRGRRSNSYVYSRKNRVQSDTKAKKMVYSMYWPSLVIPFSHLSVNSRISYHLKYPAHHKPFVEPFFSSIDAGWSHARVQREWTRLPGQYFKCGFWPIIQSINGQRSTFCRKKQCSLNIFCEFPTRFDYFTQKSIKFYRIFTYHTMLR